MSQTNEETRKELRTLLKRYRKAYYVWVEAENYGERVGEPPVGSQFFACKIRACERELKLYDGAMQ